MATINNLPILSTSTIVPSRVSLPVTCSTKPGATYRLPLSTVITLGKGNIGYSGSVGARGPQGPQGLRGFAGSRGFSGSAGPQGISGPIGPQGLRGYTGSAGSIANVTVNLSTVTSSITPVSSDIYDLGAFNKSWRAVYTNELYVNSGNIKDLQSGLPILFAGSGTTGSGYLRGFTGSVGPQGSQGSIGFTGSAGAGSSGPQGSQGAIGFTGSVGAGGISLYEEDYPLGTFTALNFVGLTVTASTQTNTIATITITGASGTGTNGVSYTGSRGFTGSAGSQGSIGFTGSSGTGGTGTGYTGSIGFTGSAGAGGIGYTGSAGTSGGGTTFVFQNPGFNYSVDGFADTTYPTLTLVRGQTYYFNFTNVTGSHPIALRLTSGNTTTVPGATGNNASSGVSGITVTYQVPFDAPATIYYQCVYHSGMIGTINIVDQTGFTGSAGSQGSIGFTGSAGTGYTGSAGIGNTGFTGSVGSQGSIGFTGSSGSTTSEQLTWSYYDTELQLPNAATKHGMFAHVHSTGYGYMAHAGAWIKLANYNDIVGTGNTGYTGSAGTGNTGYTGSAGTGNTGYTGSAGTGNTGYTGSQGTSGGGTTFVFQNVGFNYSVDGFADTTYPTLTLVRGQLYNFNFTNVTSSHPIALRLTSGSTTAVPGATGNNASSGVYGTAVTYQVPFDAPATIYYQCVYHSGMIGTINIVDQTGFTGSVGSQGAIGFTGSAGTGGGNGYTGSAGVVTTLANGTYTISTLYVSTLTVSSVGAATIQSGNDLNLRAVGQITVNAPFVLTTATVSTLTSLSGITQRGAMVFVTDASGGAQPCYFDGTSWYTVNGRVQVA